MIPKKIHYCWLSGEKFPKKIQECFDTWKKVMPDYELVLWDKKKFDTDSVPFVKEACSVGKWAFAADYIRLYSVYAEGGIYFDSDVIAIKRFDDFLGHDFFSAMDMSRPTNTRAFENVQNRDLENIYPIGLFLQASVFGGIKGHPFLRNCLDWYESRHFILPDGSYLMNPIAPDIQAAIAQKHGFRYINELQKLEDNMVIYPMGVFPSFVTNATAESYAVHCGTGSWTIRLKGIMGLLNALAWNDSVRKLFGRKPMEETVLRRTLLDKVMKGE
jgi:mannosyltransferase OCH1-like enzyme